MRLTATDIYDLHRPRPCELRSYLIAKGVVGAEPSPFQELLKELGKRHEEAHLATFPEVLNLSAGDIADRQHRTLEAMDQGHSVIYQAVLRAQVEIGGEQVEVIGEPDFLIREAQGYVVRDCKISRRITEKDHPEILKALGLYGWLYERTRGEAPIRLEVFSGAGEIVPVDYDGGASALEELARIAAVVRSEPEPYEPVGWTKCGTCAYRARNWDAAVARRDADVIPDVDQGLARALREVGVQTYDDLLGTFDEGRLSEFKRPWGRGLRKVGTNAAAIMRSARALATGEEIVMAPPELPDARNFVMFDLEGLPPQLDEIDKIYLWGTQVFGENPSQYCAALAGFGEGGDKEGWDAFLGNAREIFEQYGNIPFVHWHVYEKTKLDMYVERYGDREGIAARIRANLLNLLPVTENSIVLPIPSYSLKVVEQYVGFRRTQKEYGGEWSMARYIQATETEDEALRAEVVDEICIYNREDLEATWAVLCWLKSKAV